MTYKEQTSEYLELLQLKRYSRYSRISTLKSSTWEGVLSSNEKVWEAWTKSKYQIFINKSHILTFLAMEKFSTSSTI